MNGSYAISITERGIMDRKIINVSPKRQITIPAKYFEMLHIGSEVECYVKDNALVIKPIQQGYTGEFAEEILQELVAQGYTGEQLIVKFKEMNRKVRPAIEAIIDEADKAAAKLKGSGDDKMADIFGTEE